MFEKVGDLFGPEMTLDISGTGEILIHPRFRAIVNRVKESGAALSFSTNGIALTPETVDYLLGTTLETLNISINSLVPETHRLLTGRGRLPEVLSNLDYLFGQERRFSLTLSMVITGYNWREMESFVDYGAARLTKATDAVRFLPLAPSGKYVDPGLMPPEGPEFAAMVKQSEDTAKRHGLILQSFNPTPEARGYSKLCSAPWVSMVISMDGPVRPCCWTHRAMGDIREQSWWEIWNGERYREFRESVASGRMTYCQNCREFA
jgi:MoaA/NifB/PqqE/SkfB family radical SAM enzyme